MSDEETVQGGEPEPGPPAVAAPAGSGEQIVMLGAAIVVADYVLFGLIIDEYFFFTGTLLAAAYALFAVWWKRSRSVEDWPISYGRLLRLLGLTVGFLGLVEFLGDLRFGVLDNVGDILAGLILYAGCFLMYWGGRQVPD
jgi:hypothetical protein